MNEEPKKKAYLERSTKAKKKRFRMIVRARKKVQKRNLNILAPISIIVIAGKAVDSYL